MQWATRRELCDLQLGLAIAALMPASLAPGWQGLLERWRQAHEADSVQYLTRGAA